MIVVPGSRPVEQMRRINELIREKLTSDADQEPVAFFCECSDPNCYRSVWLTVAAYEAARGDDGRHGLRAEHGAPGWGHAGAQVS